MYQQNNFDLQTALSNIQGQIAQLRPNTYYTPPQMPAFVPQAPLPEPKPILIQRQVNHVDGIQGAKEYQDKLDAGSSEILLDNDNNVFYMVMKDANGNSPANIVVGDFTLRKQEVTKPEYVTRQDFDAFTAEIKQLLGAKEEQK